eukprot:Lankesteria_metandrocarpae@DN5151_c1_g1_i2.p1
MDMFEGLVFVFCSIILNTSFVGITDACVGRGNDGLIANSKANSSRGGLHHRSRKQQDSQQQSEDHPTTAGDVERQQQEPVSCEAPPSAAAIASVERAPQQLTDSASSGHVAKGRGAMSHAEIWD